MQRKICMHLLFLSIHRLVETHCGLPVRRPVCSDVDTMLGSLFEVEKHVASEYAKIRCSAKGTEDDR